MDFQGIIVYIAVYAIPVVFAITLHEAGHAYAAKYFGDKTAWMLGRTSLNPARHIDPIGTIVMPVLTAFTGFLFGWAKPVPVNFENLRDPKRDMLWVAAAGPGANLAMAFLWVLGCLLSLQGDATASTAGGTIELYLAADHDSVIDYYTVRIYEDDLQIGPNTDQDALKLDIAKNLYLTAATFM